MNNVKNRRYPSEEDDGFWNLIFFGNRLSAVVCRCLSPAGGGAIFNSPGLVAR